MKGVVFSLKKSDFAGRNRRKITVSDLRYFFKRYGVMVMCVTLLFAGLIFGSAYAQNSTSSLLDSLDFLFTTNLDVRLSQNAAETFCACFASDFIFLFVVFLLGLAPWGIPMLLFVLFFKGFGTGLTAGYLYMAHSLKGVGFYLIVLLPGTFLFCMALSLFSTSAFYISKRMFFYTIGHNVPAQPLRKGVINFCSRSMSSLIMTFFSALLDVVLWTLFAGVFNF